MKINNILETVTNNNETVEKITSSAKEFFTSCGKWIKSNPMWISIILFGIILLIIISIIIKITKKGR